MSIYDVLNDLYQEAYNRKVLRNWDFFIEDAEKVLILYEYWGYTYLQAIDETLNDIEVELIDLALCYLLRNYGKE